MKEDTMSKKMLEKPETFDEAVEAAYNSPNKVFKIDTPYGDAEVRIIMPASFPPDEKKREIKEKEKKTKKSSKQTQKQIIEALYGAWPIDETADELIARIKGMRKDSKIISLKQ